MKHSFWLSAAILTAASALGACGQTPAETDSSTNAATQPVPKAETRSSAPGEASGLSRKVGQDQLTPERLNADPSINGASLRRAKISPDGTMVTVLQGREDDAKQQDMWAYNLETGEGKVLVSSTDLLGGPEALSTEEKNRRERMREYGSGIVSYQWAGDNQLLFPLGGDIFTYDLKAGKSQRVTETKGFETDAKVSKDGRYVTYVRADELHVTDLESGTETQLTADANDTIRNATASFVVQEEFGRSTGYWLSPDASVAAYTQIDESPIKVENRIEFTANDVVNVAQRYPFAGTANATVKLGLVPRKGGKTRWVKLGNDDDIYLTRASWSADSSTLWVGILSRDHKTHTFYAVDPLAGTAEVLFTETSPTWLNIGKDLKPLKSGGFIWTSEPTDMRQIFKVSADGKQSAITPNDVMVNSVNCIDEEAGLVHFTGYKDDNLERHLFTIGMDGKGLKQISERSGRHGASFSKNCQRYIGYFSNYNTPSQTRAFKADGTPLAWLNENALGAGHPYQPYVNSHVTPEFGTLPAEDGTPLNYILYKPSDLKAGEKRPAITMVYGGPTAQTVTKTWRGGFPQMLADYGFVVFQMDNRGTSNRGKKFQDFIYRKAGQIEVTDQAAGAKWLASQNFVDGGRMGVYGWSYGGYMALHMLGQTDLYASGVSGAPVTDWALYDTAYTERYMGSPVPDSPNYTKGAYENSRVLAHLDGLTEPILLIHGMADDNVVFRHSIKLMDAMQDSGAQNLRIMTYPGEKHGFRRKSNRIHKDTQILDFFLETLGDENAEN